MLGGAADRLRRAIVKDALRHGRPVTIRANHPAASEWVSAGAKIKTKKG